MCLLPSAARRLLPWMMGRTVSTTRPGCRPELACASRNPAPGYSPTEPVELSGRAGANKWQAALSKRLARCVESALHHLGSQTPVISTGHGAIPAPPTADAARISARQTATNAQKCWCETRKADQMRRQTRVCLPPAATVLPLWPPAATAVQQWPTARQTAASVVRNRRHLPASPESP